MNDEQNVAIDLYNLVRIEWHDSSLIVDQPFTFFFK